jgi:hypothetical protein
MFRAKGHAHACFNAISKPNIWHEDLLLYDVDGRLGKADQR